MLSEPCVGSSHFEMGSKEVQKHHEGRYHKSSKGDATKLPAHSEVRGRNDQQSRHRLYSTPGINRERTRSQYAAYSGSPPSSRSSAKIRGIISA